MTKKNNSYEKDNPTTIQSMFGAIAPKYDITNAILSFNIHKYWNRKLIKNTFSENPTSVLDLCCGTGEIAFSWLKNHRSQKNVTLLDFCPEMLEVAKKRAPDFHSLTFIEADAQKIPLPDSSFEATSVAYGIRNVKNPKLCFQEVYRVLKPGGKFGILELTEPKNLLLQKGHKFYLTKLLPVLGGILTANPKAYHYLANSIQIFSKPDELKSTLEKTGFKNIEVISMSGGIAHLIIGNK